MLRYTRIFISLLLRFSTFIRLTFLKTRQLFSYLFQKVYVPYLLIRLLISKSVFVCQLLAHILVRTRRGNYIQPVHHDCQFNKVSFLRYRTSVKHIFLYDSKKGLTVIGEIGTQYGKPKDITDIAERQHR